jgi:hypothetical protein
MQYTVTKDSAKDSFLFEKKVLDGTALNHIYAAFQLDGALPHFSH